ncbi:MAG: DUF2142 domain-containing protein [bacterium]|nr:DUF2142 domain-containing protein [bacterium]
MKQNRKKGITLLYFALYLTAALTVALHQPLYDVYPYLPNPPDEHSRYLVPLYICNHGTLPTGYEAELFSGDCKWTYGFYTLLPYMIQGFAMRFVNLFTESPLALLYTARLVNVAFGLVMAYVVLLLGKKLFRDERLKWLFCFLAVFLPQGLFLHTYTNPDSLCMLSVALILYGLARGYGDGFSFGSCGLLTAGIILCTLSYYNAYGYILGSIVLFAAYFLKKEDGGWRCDWRGLLKKGLSISAVVLLCISWSFIRNYVLYDGDFIGLETKQTLVKSFGVQTETYATQGISLLSMLFGTAFFPKMAVSFIANYGSATLYTWKIVYVFYLALFGAGILGLFFRRRGGEFLVGDRWRRILIHGVMAFCIAMPLLLLIRYSYTVDYQAQGRYLLPALVPGMYYVVRGLVKLPLWDRASEKRKNVLFLAVMSGIVVSLLVTVYVTALPYYLQQPVLYRP